MEVKFNITGKERKSLAKAIGEITGAEVEYLGVPSCNYSVSYFTIDRGGTLIFDDEVDSERIGTLLEALEERGFISEKQAAEKETEKTTVDGLVVEMPRTLFTEAALDNLEKLVEVKASIIKKALGTDSLPINKTEERISFPWFHGEHDSITVKAYTHFVAALCEMARTQKRINGKEKEIENEKYAFRCFLLRLGFIGLEYKEERKVLLKNLTGSSAFKGGAKNEVSE